MSKVVFILGAGASKDCGAPLMNDFLDTAARLLSAGKVKHKEEHFKRVFQAIAKLQMVHSKSQLDLNNIESIFTALEIANALGKLPGFESKEIPLVIDSLKELIVATLEKTIEFPTAHGHIQATKSYEKFANLLSHISKEAEIKMRTAVMSFNYDVALDIAIARAGLGPDYGFGKQPRSSYPIPLMKLHGSLNWGAQKSGRVEPILPEDYLNKYKAHYGSDKGTVFVPIGSQLQEYFSNNTDYEVEPEPVIVPPAWNKADYHKTLRKVWAATAEHLSDAEYIFIMGYSLPETDAFFKLLYGLGTAGDALLQRIVVYNPDKSGETESRFRSMLGPGALARFDYKPLTFAQAIDDVMKYFPRSKLNG